MVLNAITMFVSLNMLAIVLIFGPNLVVFLFRVLVGFLLCVLIEFLNQLLWYIVVFCYCLYCLPFFMFFVWV